MVSCCDYCKASYLFKFLPHSGVVGFMIIIARGFTRPLDGCGVLLLEHLK